LKTLRFKPRVREFVDYKSTLPAVIPAQAGNQVFFRFPTKPMMDAGLRRHDKSSLWLKVRDFNQPRKGH